MLNKTSWMTLSYAVLLVLSGCGGESSNGTQASTAAVADAQHPPASAPTSASAATTDQAYADPNTYSGNKTDSLPEVQAVEAAAVTHHKLKLANGTLHYTATEGHLTATDPTTGQQATIFYTAYTLDGVARRKRPVTFSYNGGPGGASMALHMGAWSPVQLVTGDPAVPDPNTLPTTYPMVDNAESLLDTTDLVYIDPPGTGFSEAISPATNGDFWSVDSDARIFEGFIQRYLTVNKRNVSPLYLYGESYGTPRTDVLVNMLEEDGVDITGIVLQSSVLDQDPLHSTQADAYLLPSWAAVGTYFGLVAPTPSLASYVTSVQTYADGTFATALNAPNPTAYSSDMAGQLTAYIGVPATTWQKYVGTFNRNYAKNFIQGQLIGRYDGRVKVPALSAWALADSDPSDELTAPFGSQGVAYMANTLKYTDTSSTYIAHSPVANKDWNWSHDGVATTRFNLDTIPDLQSALLLNPRLKVLSLNGFDDLATPFSATETSLARLGSQPNLTMQFYDGGHMIYLNEASRVPLKTDLVTFYTTAGITTSVASPASVVSAVSTPASSTSAASSSATSVAMGSGN
jgi:carboxypeptidase C (cathepsin A)